jgi:hypothetical protein
MNKSCLTALLCVLVTLTAAAQDVDTSAMKGKMLTASNGARLGQVFRVAADGSVQMIIEGKLISVPVSTLTSVDGRLTTSLSKNEVLALR